MEIGLSRAIKAGHAARLEVNKLFPDVHLEIIKGVRDLDGSSLWMEYVLWASEGFNRSATTANTGMLSPHEVFLGDRTPMSVLPLCKPAYHRVPRRRKMNPQARPCFPLILDTAMGAIASRSWTRRREESCTRATLHGTSRGNRLFPRPRQLDRECPTYHPVPKRRTTCTSSRHLQLLPRLPPLQLPPRRCLHQLSPHPRRYQPPRINSRSRFSGTGA